MARKRQRKKQQTQQTIKALKKVGIHDKKHIKQLKNKPKEANRLVAKEQRNITARARGKLLTSLGYTGKEHSSKRYWGQARWDEWLKGVNKKRKAIERKKEAKSLRELKNREDLYLLIFWKEKTDAYEDSQTLIDTFKEEYKYMPVEYLIQSLNAFIHSEEPVPAMIGTAAIALAKGKDRKQVIQLYTGYDDGTMAGWNMYGLVYEGKAVNYRALLVAIHAVIRLLYDNSEKATFMNTLLSQHLPRINQKMAKRLAKDLNWRSF